MTSNTNIPTAVIDAYQQAHFRVFNDVRLVDGGFVLRIREFSPEIRNLFTKEGVETAAFVTAYNPLGQDTAPAINVAAQATLEETVANNRLPFYRGQGEDPKGIWLSEASVLIMGVSYENACSLGNQHQQNAIVWIGSDSIPQLILLR